MSVKTITVSEDAYALLAANKRAGESFSEVIRRLTRQGRSLDRYAGCWKTVPAARFDEAMSHLRDLDTRGEEEFRRLTQRRRRR